jgi:hypothetical protein
VPELGLHGKSHVGHDLTTVHSHTFILGTRRTHPGTADRVLDWLLEVEQPSVRYRTLTQLLWRPEVDPELVEAGPQIPVRGGAAELLRERRPESWWLDGASLYRPK